MSDIQITRARLVPMNGEDRSPETDWIPVQFNPNSLRITYSNTMAAERSTGTAPSPAPQYIDKSESSLSVQLFFDTSIAGELVANSSNAGAENNSSGAHTARNHQANSDVRLLTKKIADAFMNPELAPDSNGHKVPKRCQFEWGSFIFKGMVSSYNETLDFFSPEGIPLRATVALTLKEDAYQFLRDENIQASQRNIPTFSSANASTSAAQAATANGKNPKNWRDIALFNGIEDVRAIGRQAISVPNLELEKMSSRVGSPEIGFGVGASASLGSSIPGAFKWK
jgi:hypothetical protein